MKTIVALFMVMFLLGQRALAEPPGTVPSRIRRTTVESSNVASVGYSRELHALEIEFVRGAVYRFLNVPAIVYRELLAAQSKGHFIFEHLRGKYEFVRIRPRQIETHALERVVARGD